MLYIHVSSTHSWFEFELISIPYQINHVLRPQAVNRYLNKDWKLLCLPVTSPEFWIKKEKGIQYQNPAPSLRRSLPRLRDLNIHAAATYFHVRPFLFLSVFRRLQPPFPLLLLLPPKNPTLQKSPYQKISLKSWMIYFLDQQLVRILMAYGTDTDYGLQTWNLKSYNAIKKDTTIQA